MAKATNPTPAATQTILSKDDLGNIGEYMQAHEEATSVYFNDAGAWHFTPQEGFDNTLTRAEVLGQTTE